MNTSRRKTKKRLCIQHRKDQYLYAIQKVIDGEAPPEYATTRYQKLKEIKGKNNGKNN